MTIFNKKKENKDILKKLKKRVQKKNDKNNIKGFKFFEVIIIVIVTGLLCSMMTGAILYHHYNNSYNYEKLSDNENINKFLQVYASIINEYYENVNEPELIDSAINAMFDYLGDDYSEELSKDNTETLLEQLAGEYKGIGVEITGDKIVYSVFKDSPAEKAGILKDDRIIKVNDEDMSDKDNSYVANYIKNSENDFITITVNRGEEEKTFEVEKNNLFIPSVTSEIKEGNNKKIGYIYISTFSNTTAEQFKTNLEEIESSGIESLIIDVRSNAGGYVTAARDISSLFLDKGKVIYSLQSKNNTKEYKDTTVEKRNYNIAVLINEYSASASEILASALKDSYGATLIGKTSYGKGKVQQTLNLSDGSMVKYTTAKWLRPNGECVDNKGITPDYEIDLEINEEEQSLIDTQLDKALEILSS